MTNSTLARWLLVAVAIVGLAVAAPLVSAHDDGQTKNDGTAADGIPVDGTAAEWAAWMESHMTDHVGPGAVDEMEPHVGLTVDEMARHMTDGDHATGTTTGHAEDYHTTGRTTGMADGDRDPDEGYGRGHGC